MAGFKSVNLKKPDSKAFQQYDSIYNEVKNKPNTSLVMRILKVVPLGMRKGEFIGKGKNSFPEGGNGPCYVRDGGSMGVQYSKVIKQITDVCILQ